jgi:hypothetical protein
MFLFGLDWKCPFDWYFTSLLLSVDIAVAAVYCCYFIQPFGASFVFNHGIASSCLLNGPVLHPIDSILILKSLFSLPFFFYLLHPSFAIIILSLSILSDCVFLSFRNFHLSILPLDRNSFHLFYRIASGSVLEGLMLTSLGPQFHSFLYRPTYNFFLGCRPRLNGLHGFSLIAKLSMPLPLSRTVIRSAVPLARGPSLFVPFIRWISLFRRVSLSLYSIRTTFHRGYSLRTSRNVSSRSTSFLPLFVFDQPFYEYLSAFIVFISPFLPSVSFLSLSAVIHYNQVQIMLVTLTSYFYRNTFIYHFGYIYLDRYDTCQIFT